MNLMEEEDTTGTDPEITGSSAVLLASETLRSGKEVCISPREEPSRWILVQV